MTADHDVIVIGGGHNGLVAACYMAKAGLKPLVLEGLPYVGGMSSCDRPIPEAPNHVMHPCAVDLFLMRSSTVLADLQLAAMGFREVEFDPSYIHLTPDGGSIAFWRDARRTADEMARFSRRDAAAYLELHEAVDAVVRITGPLTGVNPMRPPLRALAKAAALTGRSARSLRGAFDVLFTAPIHTLTERFEHPVVRDALVSLVGTVGPLTSVHSGAGFLMLPHLQRYGVSRPVGGMEAMMAAFVRRLESWGGAVRTSARVEEIVIRGGRAQGVRLLGGEELAAPAGVVAACDPRMTLERMVPPGVLSDTVMRRVRRLPANADGSGELKVDIALSELVSLSRFEKWRGDGLDLRVPVAVVGTVDQFLKAYPVSAAGKVPDPMPAWLYVTSSIDRSLAPPGQDSLYLYSACVPLEPIDPPEEHRPAAAKALCTTAGIYYDGLESEIGRRIQTSADMSARYNVTNGCLFHVDMNLFHLGPLRPAFGLGGYRTPVKGLYLSGAGTHPGAGVGGYAGQNAAREVVRDARKAR